MTVPMTMTAPMAPQTAFSALDPSHLMLISRPGDRGGVVHAITAQGESPYRMLPFTTVSYPRIPPPQIEPPLPKVIPGRSEPPSHRTDPYLVSHTITTLEPRPPSLIETYGTAQVAFSRVRAYSTPMG